MGSGLTFAPQLQAPPIRRPNRHPAQQLLHPEQTLLYLSKLCDSGDPWSSRFMEAAQPEMGWLTNPTWAFSFKLSISWNEGTTALFQKGLNRNAPSRLVSCI